MSNYLCVLFVALRVGRTKKRKTFCGSCENIIYNLIIVQPVCVNNVYISMRGSMHDLDTADISLCLPLTCSCSPPTERKE